MAFVEHPGLKGKVYVPEEKPGKNKKHACRDCFSCQMCGDNRCSLCKDSKLRIGEEPSGKKGPDDFCHSDPHTGNRQCPLKKG